MKHCYVRLITLFLVFTFVSIAVAESGFTELTKGSKGQIVTELQQKLNELGYSVGRADGVYGNKTVAAVTQFQIDHVLPQTGSVDWETYKYIRGIIEAPEIDISDVSLAGEEIFVLKDALHILGYLKEDADENYDTKTATAVQCFQAACYKDINGIADDELINLAVEKAAEYKKYIRPFMSGLKYGYININGDIVIEPKYEDTKGMGAGAGFFCDGLAKVYNGSRWGYINADGEIAISPQWPAVYDFSQERAFVQNGSEKLGIIDNTGKQIIGFEYDNVACYFTYPPENLSGAGWYKGGCCFSDGLAAVCKDGKWGYVDLSGNIAIELQYDQAGVFYGGYAVVEKDKQVALINTSGNVIIPFGTYSSIGPYKCSRLVVEQSGKYGVISIDQNIVVPFGTYQRIGDFSEGKASVLLGEGQYGYITVMGNLQNNVSTSLTVKHSSVDDYEDAQYHSGIAKVMIDEPDGYAFIDLNGEVVVSSDSWKRVDIFDCGLAEVWEAKGQLAFYKTDGTKLTSFTTGGNRGSSFGTSTNKTAYEQIASTYLKSKLKNPDSLQVHSISSYVSNGYYVVSIDYSAMNGFGGYNRKTFYCMIDGNGTVKTAYSF